MENSKTIEPHKFAHNLSQRLDLRISDKQNMSLFKNLSIYYTWKMEENSKRTMNLK